MKRHNFLNGKSQVTVINDIFVYLFACRPSMKQCFPRPLVGKIAAKTGAKTLHII